MSTSEIESAKIDLKTTKKLNGWWRLWVVVSTIWFLIVISYGTISWFEEKLDKEVAKHYKIIESLDVEYQRMILQHFEKKTGVDVQRVEFPNGQMVDFKLPIDENKINDFGKMYWESGKSIQFRDRTNFGLIGLSFLILPPITIAIIGKSIAWIVKGFKS
jgi:hypothetical protein